MEELEDVETAAAEGLRARPHKEEDPTPNNIDY